MTGVEGSALEIRVLGAELEGPFAAFLERLRASGGERQFHPHPLDADAAAVLVRRTGRDQYYVMTQGDSVVAYGMLRGWDEGFETPSLGIAVDPAWRSLGIARAMMLFLHAAARRQGARRIRLTVGADNAGAIALYRSLGYELEPHAEGVLVGTMALAAAAEA